MRSARALLALLAFGAVVTVARAQDILQYRVVTQDDLLARETARALEAVKLDKPLPRIGCSIEYIRQLDGRDIVYRRGPIPLHSPMERDVEVEARAMGASPETADENAQRETFFGGLLVDLPLAGEASNFLSTGDENHRYMLRASLVPQSYVDGVLSAKIVLERAVVEVHDRSLEVLQSEVFSRAVTLHGNEPLNFALPAWEIAEAGGMRTVPSSLQESLLITLETPRHFGFSQNRPEPFSTATDIAYAVPVPSNIVLRIAVNGVDRVIDSGRKEPGVHEVTWTPGDVPDGNYTAVMTATAPDGSPLYENRLDLTKDHNAPAFTQPTSAAFRRFAQRFDLSLESGVAYQIPVDRAKSLRNMFTHIALRLGYRFSPAFEAGIAVGQDAFHEEPGPEVDIARIGKYGGVVPYTYGYAGPYARWTPGESAIRPAAQLGLMFSNAAPLVEAGFGVTATVFSEIQLYLVPDALIHLRSDVSAKLGLVYGANVRF